MPLSEIEKKTLLSLARKAVESAAVGRPLPRVEEGSPGLNEDAGAFVSLHRGKLLRGCIGVFSSPDPLYRTVMEMAVSAATKDPRFIPVRVDELNSLQIEISVLSPMKRITDISEIEPGRHGIFIIKGRSRGVLLPQVAAEHGFGRVAFLENTCLKAGLGPDEWKRGAEIYVFEAEIFKEAEAKERSGL